MLYTKLFLTVLRHIRLVVLIVVVIVAVVVVVVVVVDGYSKYLQ